MQIDYDNLLEIILYGVGFFIVYFIFYKKYIYSPLDPLFIYVFTISFASVLVVYILEESPLSLYHFFICNLFLYFGFTLGTKWMRYKKTDLPSQTCDPTFYDKAIFRNTVYVLFCLYMLANIILFYTTGFALLSDEPTVAKVENFIKGFGIILKINWGVGSFLTAGLIYLILLEKRGVDGLLLGIIVVFTALEGSKSSLLRILITLFLLLNHAFFRDKQAIIRKIKLLAPLGIFGLFSIFFIVLFKENADSEQAIFAFVKRLLYGADSTLYFYHPVNEQYFARFHPSDYILHFLNPILTFMRLVPNEEALGNVIVMNALPGVNNMVNGPNTPYYVEGQVYFGYVGAFFYSAIIGLAYSLIREYFFNTKYYSAFWFVLICCICQQAYFLCVEVTLFITQVFDTLFFVIPTYVVVSLIMSRKIQFRRFHY
ncbi:O-antigen polymerase [Fibrella aquatica]|uniref:O-antigen polymerase n=1 Tax=Fibrella aquatica TaxID=3242487 RepID=UPI00352203E5